MIGDRLGTVQYLLFYKQTNRYLVSVIQHICININVSVKCICLAMQYYTVVDVANVLNMGMFVETLQ